MSEERYCQTIEELREWAKGRALALGCNLKDKKVQAILESYEVCFIHGQKSREAALAGKDAALRAAASYIRARKSLTETPNAGDAVLAQIRAVLTEG